MLRDKVLRIAAVLLSTVVLGACGSVTKTPEKATVPPPVPPEQLTDVVLKVGDQKGNQRSLLAAANLLDTPYRIEWSTFTSGPPLLEAVAAGAVDVGGVGNTPPLFAAAAGSPISIVSAAKQDPVSDAVLVPQDSPLRLPADLRGKRIGVAKGSSAHGNLLNILSEAEIPIDEVDIAFMQPAEAYSAFSQGQIDAWAVWDPYTAQAELQANARVLVDGRGTSNGYSFEVASNKALEDPAKNAAIADFVVRLAKAQHYNATHPEERAKVWTEETGGPIEVTRLAAERRHQVPVPMDQALVDSEQQLVDAFVEARVIPTKFRFEDFVDRRYEQQVVTAR
ncbi:ABC transporter substrate-binding protein [Saccharopolyspora rectivirgula]|uniref:ABC transporter substrate-binding protein n=1 Tax=Saccharopolyspora rectivirgula TaxID=28042 RepID=UPI0004120E93|nr:ABC transporter substrate-binding protein [Saccharopolyspora rectivirgula]